MKSIFLKTTVLTCALSCSFQALAQQQLSTQDLQNLTAQEQNEYSSKLRSAGSDAEREKINSQYQEMTQQRNQLKKGKGSSQGQSAGSPSAGHGQGNPNKGGKAGPAGNKNKPQKQGR